MGQAVTLLHGDCLAMMGELQDASVDAVVTDPPYGLSFMGKRWDYEVPSVEVWRECLRVLKPGGHLLAFAGTRTQHRMACNIEDAGFDIRDMIAWVYGSGFPKSLDVSKAIDKRGGNAHLTAEIGAALKSARKSRGVSVTEADRTYCGGVTLWSWYEGRPAGQQMPTGKVMRKIANDWTEMRRYADLIEEAEREVVGQSTNGIAGGSGKHAGESDAYGFGAEFNITAPATDAAKQWAGWGTALKPAMEPITVARKPLIGTVAENVLRHGTGAINVDGCRVGTEDDDDYGRSAAGADGKVNSGIWSKGARPKFEQQAHSQGRFPANIIHDGSDEVVGLFPESTRWFNAPRKGDGKSKDGAVFGQHSGSGMNSGDSGSAARFFYCAKASKRDRDEGNRHPTVKPTDLMRYLVRLVTPPGGIVLDPFMGSGSTGKACALEGFRFIGIEREAEYIEIAKRRIMACQTSSR